MLICPGCKTVLRNVPALGKCPKCGHLVDDDGVRTAGPQAPTMDLTVSQAPAPSPGSARPKSPPAAGREPQVTQDLPPSGDRRTFTIAPRKLSAKSIENITNSWRGAVSGESNPRSSLKLDSQLGASGSASSLVVNLRGVRTTDEVVRTNTGADYELLQVIGKGGMGVVYSARQASVDRMVAVKMIRPNVAADAERREKFLSEAVVTGDLDHPNIVPIYELGSDEQNALFYSMKRVQGTPWSQVLGDKPLAENLEVLMKVADAVAFAHANGVVHRDLKPENVMLGDFGEVLVMDWGLALATRSFRHAEFVTRPDSMGGTPAYMAPEMVTGPFDLIGPPCDIYLLGALLFEVVTGLRPHTGKSAQECLLAAARNDIQPTDKTGELIDIAYRAMATDPSERFASVQEFQAAIRDYQSHMESISLATRADQELAQARKSGDYQGYSHALFGFEEAAALWSGNVRAKAGVWQAKLAYAASAKEKGDFELGLSLLDADNPKHAPLRGEFEAAIRERNARQKWLSRFKRIAAAMVLLVFGVISVSLLVIAQAKNRETAAKQQAILDRDAAQKAEQAADQARMEEQAQKDKAIVAERQAKTQETAARKAEAAAVAAQEEEKRQKEIAVQAERAAEAAQRSEEQAAYVARIGMAAAKIDENAFDTARSLLDACQPENLRQWEWGYLKRLCEQGVDFPAEGTVHAVAFAPDGSWFVTTGDDRKAHLWNRDSDQPRLAIEHPAAVLAVDVSPDGRLIATGAADGVVRIARADDGAIVHEIAAHQDRVLDVAFAPRDGRWLVSASRDNTARVWNTATGDELAGSPLQGHYGWVWSAAFAPAQDAIVTASQDGKVIVWSFDAGATGKSAIRRQKTFVGHEGPVFAAAFSPDGRQVASGGYGKRLLLWQIDAVRDVPLEQQVAIGQPLAQQPSRPLEGHTAPIRAITFAPDGQFVLSGGDDNTVRIWNVMTARPHAELRGHSRPVLACAVSADAHSVLSAGQAGEIKLWEIVNFKQAPHGRVLVGHDDALLAAAFSPDGRQLVTASRDHTARVYRAASGECLHTLAEGHQFLASRAIYFDGGKRLLTAGGDKSVRLWDAAGGAQLQALENTSRAAAIAVAPDANWFVTTWFAASTAGAEADEVLAGQSQLAIFDLDAGRDHAEPRSLANAAFGTGHFAIVKAVAVAPDGSRLYSGDDAGMGKFWDPVSGAELKTLRGHTAGITAAAFSPDAKRLFTSSKDGTVASWDVATGLELPIVISLARPEHRDAYDIPVIDLSVSPDGRQLLTLSEDIVQGSRQSVVGLWNVDDGTPARELYRGSDLITSVSFGADGQTVLAAGSPAQTDAAGRSTGGMVRQFDVAAGSELAGPDGGPLLELSASGENVWSAVEAPGGADILTVGGNGAALWSPADPGQAKRIFKPHSGIAATGFSADGKHVVTASSDRRAKIWNVDTGLVELQLPPEHGGPLTAVAFSPADKRRLLTASADGTARLWDLTRQKVLWVARHGEQQATAVRAAIFSPDGQRVLTAGDDSALRTWNAASGQPLATIATDAPVICAAYSADGRHLLAGLSNGQAIIYDARTGQALVRFSGHTDAINSVAFSSDSRRALSGSRDRSVKVWSISPLDVAPERQQARGGAALPIDGKELLTLRYHDQAVTAVAFSPDDKAVLSASLDGTAVLWQADAWKAPRE